MRLVRVGKGFFHDRTQAAWDDSTRVFYLSLAMMADDDGVFRFVASHVAAKVWPHDLARYPVGTMEALDRCIAALQSCGVLSLEEHDGDTFGTLKFLRGVKR